MPSKSPAQKRFMAAAANNPQFAAQAGVPQSVARDYAAADQAKAPPRDLMATAIAMAAKRKPPRRKGK